MSKKWTERMIESEVRAYEIPEDQDYVYVEGYALRFNSPSLQLYDPRFGMFEETITPGALRNADLSDVFAKDDHGKPFARTRNKTLELAVDETGLYYKAKIDKRNTNHMNMYRDIQSGLYAGSSFEFVATREGQEFDQRSRKRTINEIKVIRDVSPVYNPAYTSSTVEARSAFSMEIEQVQKAMEIAELRKRKLILLTEIIGGQK